MSHRSGNPDSGGKVTASSPDTGGISCVRGSRPVHRCIAPMAGIRANARTERPAARLTCPDTDTGSTKGSPGLSSQRQHCAPELSRVDDVRDSGAANDPVTAAAGP